LTFQELLAGGNWHPPAQRSLLRVSRRRDLDVSTTLAARSERVERFMLFS
jgi:hypothetical protein